MSSNILLDIRPLDTDLEAMWESFDSEPSPRLSPPPGLGQGEMEAMRQELERVRAELRATKRRQKAAAGMVTTKREHRNIMRTATQQAERGVRTLEQSESS